MAAPPTTRNYRGSLPNATNAFQQDSAAMAQAGWFPTSQTYVPGSWSGAQFLLALLLCIVLIGILIFIYMVIVKPEGMLVVTYEYRGVGATVPAAPAAPVNWAISAAEAGSLCGRCGKHLSPAWVGKCQHCRARYVDFPPVKGPGTQP